MMGSGGERDVILERIHVDFLQGKLPHELQSLAPPSVGYGRVKLCLFCVKFSLEVLRFRPLYPRLGN